MDISFFTTNTNIKTSNGYGYASSNIIKSLKDLGHNVLFTDKNSPVQLNFAQPDYFKMHRNQYQIGYTPWESTVLPKAWFENLNHCDEIWTTSTWCKKVFEDNGLNNIKVFPHGVENIWYPKKRTQSEVIKFLHIGEPAPRKAGQMVVDAFAYLYGNNPNYSLTIKSYGVNTTRIYNNYIDKNIIGTPDQIYNNITINTEVLNSEDLVELYHEHDILVYPSYGEGFGFIPLQALATGMPTICTTGWAEYEKYLGPLKIKSTLIDSPWPFPHEGKVLEPSYSHLLEIMRDVVLNYNAYSGFYFAQANKIHTDYNWLQLTNNSFDHIFKKFA
jgi:glycosyltransferase involved in cell wall biosynthesis